MLDQHRWKNWITHVRSRRAGLLLVLLTIGGLGAAANALLVSGREADLPGVVTDSSAIIIQGDESEDVEAEPITLSPTGFDPKQITRARGPFLLAVSNRSGLEEVVVRVERVGAGQVHELRVSRKRKGWEGFRAI